MSATSHTEATDRPTLDEDNEQEEETTMDDGTAHAAPADPKADLTDSQKAERTATYFTYIAAIVPTILAAQGMVLFGSDVLGLDMWFALMLAGFLELALIASALWDRAAAMKGKSTRGLATWAFSLVSGSLSALHELVMRTPDGGSAWTTEPMNLLAAGIRIAAPLVAAYLWHKVLIGLSYSAEGRSMSEVRRSKRMHKTARRAHELKKIERQIQTEEARAKTDEMHLLVLRLRERHATKRTARAYDNVLKVISATDPRLSVELDVWMRTIAAGDALSALTEIDTQEGTQSVASVVKTAAPVRQQRRRPAPAAQPASHQPAPQPVARPQAPAPVATTVERSRPYLAASAPRPVLVDGSDEARARALFDQAIALNPGVRPIASDIHREAQVAANPATTRRWVQRWFEEYEAGLGLGVDRDQEQLAAEAAHEPEDGARASA